MSTIWQVAVVVLWVFVLGIGVLVLGMIRRTSDVLERLEASGQQPQVGAEPMSFVPPFELRDADGTRVTSAELFVEPASLALFVEPTCAPCRALMEELAGIGDRLEEIPVHVIVSDSTVARNGFAEGVRTLFQNGEATRAFSNHATPQAYAVGRDGFVLDRRLPSSLDDLREMARFQRTGGR
jgi:hypothetical protein